MWATVWNRAEVVVCVHVWLACVPPHCCTVLDSPCDADSSSIFAKMTWSIPAPDNDVEFSMWSMPMDDTAEV